MTIWNKKLPLIGALASALLLSVPAFADEHGAINQTRKLRPLTFWLPISISKDAMLPFI